MPIEQLNGTTLCYEETGHGEPLVLVHGAWVDHSTWELVVPGLSESFRVVTYDLRGHGRSKLDPPEAGTVHDDIADLVALIEHLDLGAVNVAGISSGACIALRFAIEQPALVRRVLPHEPPCFEYLADNAEMIPMLDEFGETLAHVQQQIEDGDHRGAAERFFDLFYPWSDLSAGATEPDRCARARVPRSAARSRRHRPRSRRDARRVRAGTPVRGRPEPAVRQPRRRTSSRQCYRARRAIRSRTPAMSRT